MANKEVRNGKNGTKLTRIGIPFINEIESVQRDRIKLRIDKKKTSIKKLANLIIKHDFWPEIKEDMIRYKEVKDGRA